MKPNPAVIATVSDAGRPWSVATWYDWEDGRALINMDAKRRRLAHIRANPHVSLTVLNPKTWLHVTIRGRIESLADDLGLRDIDRLSQRYEGEPYPIRDRPRVSGWVEVDSWHEWGPDDT
jgi:PPOX class probable F420-dependent enzyme